MQIRFYGFGLKFPPAITPTDFMNHMKTISGNRYGEYISAVCDEGNNLHSGLLLTVKDINTYCKLKDNGGSFTVTPQELEQGSSMVDVNFFVINGLTGRGIYQHYHTSASLLKGFGWFCAKRCQDLRVTMEKAALAKPNLRGSELNAIIQSFKGILTTEQLMQPEDFPTYVQALKKIESLKAEFVTFSPNEKLFRPLFLKAKKKTVILRFDPTVNMGELGEQIAKAAKEEQFRTATVVGRDDSNEEQTYKLIHNAAVLGEYQYDDMIKSVSIDSANLTNSVKTSSIITKLLAVARTPKMAHILATA